jgi:16S rRNA (guanine527-N7)-methyltransferase
MVVNVIITRLGLMNVTADAIRSEQLKNKYDYILGRAVTQVNDFIPAHMKMFKSKHSKILYWGSEKELPELLSKKIKLTSFSLYKLFQLDYYSGKCIYSIEQR